MWSSVLQWFKGRKKISVPICVNLWILAMFLLAWITFRLVSEVPGRAALELWGLCPTLPLLTQTLMAAHALPVLNLTLCQKDAPCASSLWRGTKISLGKRGSPDHVFWMFSSTGKDWCGRIGKNPALLCLLIACQDKIKLWNGATYLKICFIVREKHGHERGKDGVVMWAGHALVALI